MSSSNRKERAQGWSSKSKGFLREKFPRTSPPKKHQPARTLKSSTSDGDSPVSSPSSFRQDIQNGFKIRSRSLKRKVPTPSSSDRQTSRSQSLKKKQFHSFHKWREFEPAIKRAQTDDHHHNNQRRLHSKIPSPKLNRSGSAKSSNSSPRQLNAPQKPPHDRERRSNSISSNRSSRSNSRNHKIAETDYSSDGDVHGSHSKGRHMTVSNRKKKQYFNKGRNHYTSKKHRSANSGHSLNRINVQAKSHKTPPLTPSMSMDQATPSPPISPQSAFVNKLSGATGVQDAYQVPAHRHTYSGSTSGNSADPRDPLLMMKQPNLDDDLVVPWIMENEEVGDDGLKLNPMSPRYTRKESGSSGQRQSDRRSQHSQSNSEHFDSSSIQLKRPRSNPSPTGKTHGRTGSLQYPRMSRSPEITSNGSTSSLSGNQNAYDNIKGSSPINGLQNQNKSDPQIIHTMKSMPTPKSNESDDDEPVPPQPTHAQSTVASTMTSHREKRSSGVGRLFQKTAQILRSKTSKSDITGHSGFGFGSPPLKPGATGSRTHHGLGTLADEDEESDLSTDEEMVTPKNEKNAKGKRVLQCSVLSARKYAHYEEYEIEVTYHNETWVLYKQFKDFHDFNASLKRQYKHLSHQLPKLPSKYGQRKSKVVLERKESYHLYLQSLLSIEELCSDHSISNMLLYFLKVRGGPAVEHQKYDINLWKMGDDLVFDGHHILQLRFSARNIPIEQHEHNGCALRISQKEMHHQHYPSMREVMQTDFVIDHRHPRFCKTLLYNYYPTKDNVLKFELLLSDEPDAVPIGSATIDIATLLAKHKGYLYVPIITADSAKLPKHRRSMPDLLAKQHKNLRADENPEFTRTPCFIIAATAIGGSSHQTRSRRNSKIMHMLGVSEDDGSENGFDHSGLHNHHRALPKPPLPRRLKISAWSDDIDCNLKKITTSNNLESSDFKSAVRLMKPNLVDFHYFSVKTEDQTLREHIAKTLLQVWTKCLDSYTKGSHKGKHFKHTLLVVIASLPTRFEFDLSHIKHWEHDNVHGFKALTQYGWERVMKRYYLLFIRTLEIALKMIDDGGMDEEQEVFAKKVMGISALRMSHMQTKLVPLICQELSTAVRNSKSKRYLFLSQNYPDEKTQSGMLKIAWQDEYVKEIANLHNNAHLMMDPFYSVKNPAMDPSAWRWFAHEGVEEKVCITTSTQKEFVHRHWRYIFKLMLQLLAESCRGTMYWRKMEGFPRMEQLLLEAIIWTPLNDADGVCRKYLNFISSLMEISEMRHCIGTFGKALIRNTNALHPKEVEICFDFLREWVQKSGCFESGLLPPGFCYDSLWNAAKYILNQENWEIICVFLSFLLDHSRLFREEFRSKLFEELLLKIYFRKLCCHWNRLVRKYYFMVLLYCINRSGYFIAERRKKCEADHSIEPDIINTAHRCYVLFDSMTHLVTKDHRKGTKNRSSGSFHNLALLDTKTGHSVKFKFPDQEDEKKELENTDTFRCDMRLITKVEADCRLIELLNLAITHIKTGRKTMDSRYRPYIDSAFKQFANLCERYRRIQETQRKSWNLGEVKIPAVVYRVRDRDKQLTEFIDGAKKDDCKFVE